MEFVLELALVSHALMTPDRLRQLFLFCFCSVRVAYHQHSCVGLLKSAVIRDCHKPTVNREKQINSDIQEDDYKLKKKGRSVTV